MNGEMMNFFIAIVGFLAIVGALWCYSLTVKSGYKRGY